MSERTSPCTHGFEVQKRSHFEIDPEDIDEWRSITDVPSFEMDQTQADQYRPIRIVKLATPRMTEFDPNGCLSFEHDVVKPTVATLLRFVDGMADKRFRVRQSVSCLFTR